VFRKFSGKKEQPRKRQLVRKKPRPQYQNPRKRLPRNPKQQQEKEKLRTHQNLDLRENIVVTLSPTLLLSTRCWNKSILTPEFQQKQWVSWILLWMISLRKLVRKPEDLPGTTRNTRSRVERFKQLWGSFFPENLRNTLSQKELKQWPNTTPLQQVNEGEQNKRQQLPVSLSTFCFYLSLSVHSVLSNSCIRKNDGGLFVLLQLKKVLVRRKIDFQKNTRKGCLSAPSH